MTFSDTWKGLSGQPWGILWKTALAKLPRLAPTEALHLTNPLGPYPHIIHLPSREEGRTIPLFAFIPYQVTTDLNEKPPIVVDFHGGGFFLGTCLEQAPFCGRLARDLDAVVLTVDYRMGPVHKFPAANEDAEDVMEAVLDPGSRGYQLLRREITRHILRKRLEAHTKAVAKEYKALPKDQRKEHSKEYKEAVKAQKAQKALDKKQRQGHGRGQSDDVATDGEALSLAGSAANSDVETPVSRSSTISSAQTLQTPEGHRRLGEPEMIDLDTTRVAVAGASSGGNLALNMALDIDQSQLDEPWPCVFKPDYAHPIALLLYFPSFDARQLPSERTRPEKMPIPKGVWADMNDALMPTYLPREQAGHPRASPGLASVAKGLHKQARMQLVLCEIDNLAEQSEAWVEKVQREGRGGDLVVERYEGMKHGWTHIPEMALSEQERSTRNDALHKSVEFTRRVWEGHGC